MDTFTGALITFCVLGGSIALASALVATRRQRRVPVLVTGLLLVILVAGQFLLAPATSLLTWLPGVPFPGATLTDCHVSLADLPPPEQGPIPIPRDPLLAGQTLTISGSSVFTPFVQTIAARFDAVNGTHIRVVTSNSGAGLVDLTHHLSTMGFADAPVATLMPTPLPLLDYQLGVVPFTVIVSADLAPRMQNLTSAQLRGIFAGTITNWHAIGGPDEPITVVNRQAGSASRATFERYVLGSPSSSGVGIAAATTQQLVAHFQHLRGAISYSAANAITANTNAFLAPVCLDGQPPTATNVGNGTYVFWNIEHAYTASVATPPLAQSFLNLLCSPHWQQYAGLSDGLLPLRQLSAHALATHPDLMVKACVSAE